MELHLQGFLYTLCVVVPAPLVLYYLLFRIRFGIRWWRLLALMTVTTLIGLLLSVLELTIPVTHLARISISFGAQMMIALIAAYILRQPLSLQVFIIFVCKSYTDNIRLATDAIVAVFFPGRQDVYFSVQFLILVCTLPLLAIPFRRYLGTVLDLEPDKLFWRRLCLLPVGVFFIFRIAISPDYLWPGTALPSGPFLLSIAWPIPIFFSYFTILKAYCTSAENSQLQRKTDRARMAASVQANQNKRMLQYADHACQEHAYMLSQLCALQETIQAGNFSDAQDSLAESIGRLDRFSSVRLCENAAVDGLVKQYIQWANDAGIKMETHLLLPVRLPIPETDFFVVMGNLLENALEACIRQRTGARFLSLHADIAGMDTLIISVRNSYGFEPATRNGVYLSSKRRESPGLGLASVRAVATKYGGVARFSHADGVFEASVLLNAVSPGKRRGEQRDL